MKEFIESEIKVINSLFRHNNILAKVIKAENVLDSFVRYHLSLHASQQFKAIESLQRELSAVLAKNRLRWKISPTDIISVSKPTFGLEVNHPNPKPLHYSMRKVTNLQPNTMLCGLSALDSKPELIRFKETPHTLIAGMTNAGKSVLLQMMLLSLVANNKPEDLKLILIDLKNEDLVPFKNLPHVLQFHTDQRSAIDGVDWLIAEKDRRIEHNSTQRIVLVIDELAQLVGDRRTTQKLGDLASIGRSKNLNLIAATQSVTKDGGIGSMMKANFSCRLIGKVAPGLSSIATGLPHQQAHLLPGFGSFLRIEGSINHRFQSYFIEPNDIKLMVNWVGEQYKLQTNNTDMKVDITGYGDNNHQIYTSNNETQQITGYFPIGQLRDLDAKEIAEVKRLAQQEQFQYQAKPSLSKLTLEVFGSKSPERMQKIKEVLNVDVTRST
jgi:DNA segregation ATPase FtsK/SpoIIIE-like protein